MDLDVLLVLGAGFLVWREMERREQAAAAALAAERAAAIQEAEKAAALEQARDKGLVSQAKTKAKDKSQRIGEYVTSCVGYGTGGASIGMFGGPKGVVIGALTGCGVGVGLELMHDQGWI